LLPLPISKRADLPRTPAVGARCESQVDSVARRPKRQNRSADSAAAESHGLSRKPIRFSESRK